MVTFCNAKQVTGVMSAKDDVSTSCAILVRYHIVFTSRDER